MGVRLIRYLKAFFKFIGTMTRYSWHAMSRKPFDTDELEFSARKVEGIIERQKLEDYLDRVSTWQPPR